MGWQDPNGEMKHAAAALEAPSPPPPLPPAPPRLLEVSLGVAMDLALVGQVQGALVGYI